MKTIYTQALTAMLLLLASCPNALAFAPKPVASSGLASTTSLSATTVSPSSYVPAGLTPEQYRKIKQQDKKKTVGKDLGRLGPRGFQSRSMQAWQEAYERGETGHEFAPFGYRQQLQQGKIGKKDVPYMVRGGSWDDSDVIGNVLGRLKWNKTDKEYAKGGYKKEQSASILGSGPGLNWTGEKRDPKKNTKKLMPGFS